jgi:hypothetical protein
MDQKLNNYRTIITGILKKYAAIPVVSSSDSESFDELILDTERDHYQILTIGWEAGKRIYYPVFHLDIINNKIWVQENASDFDLVGELEAKGVSKSDIVLAFHAPFKRKFTDYAVA